MVGPRLAGLPEDFFLMHPAGTTLISSFHRARRRLWKASNVLAFLLMMLATVCKLQAGPDITWISDSYNSFDVVLSGTGLGWSGTITSPNGLWQLQTANLIEYPAPQPTSSLVCIENVGDATYLGQLPSNLPAPDPSDPSPFNTASISTYGGYMDYFKPVAPIADGSSLDYGISANDLSDSGAYQDWSGMSTITITSLPNPCDPSTWCWIANYAASGESLEAPEPKVMAICAMGMMMWGCFVGRKKGSHYFRHNPGGHSDDTGDAGWVAWCPPRGLLAAIHRFGPSPPIPLCGPLFTPGHATNCQ